MKAMVVALSFLFIGFAAHAESEFANRLAQLVASNTAESKDDVKVLQQVGKTPNGETCAISIITTKKVTNSHTSFIAGIQLGSTGNDRMKLLSEPSRWWGFYYSYCPTLAVDLSLEGYSAVRTAYIETDGVMGKGLNRAGELSPATRIDVYSAAANAKVIHVNAGWTPYANICLSDVEGMEQSWVKSPFEATDITIVTDTDNRLVSAKGTGASSIDCRF